MRTKLVTVVVAGGIGLAGLTLAAPSALAAVGATDSAAAVSSRVDKVKAALAGLVKDGTLTQAQADKVASTLGSADLRGGPGGHGGRGGPGGGRDLTAAATALGMSEADLRTALDGGKTLAQIAGDKNVPVDSLVAKLVEAGKARIAKDVTDGRLTQAQADTILADLTERITQRVNATRPAHEGRERPNGDASPSATE
jgi:polyhydroxyalkanoate synthesis regulator phasin